MIIIKNHFLPFKGYKAITIWPFIFTRIDLDEISLNHENIHGKQQLEMLILFFYIWYGIEYLIRFLFYHKYNPYRMISFEVEAYKNQDDLNYLKNRKLYSWFKYL